MRPAARHAAWIALLASLALAGCTKRPAVLVVDDLLEPMTPEVAWLPTASDLAAAKLARLALVATPPPTLRAKQGAAGIEVERALAELQGASDAETGKRLIPLGVDLRNATLDDPIGYRRASRALKRRSGIDPRLASRLDRTVEHDPIRLALKRQLDGWHALWARTFNAVSEPLGNSLITGFVIAPFQLASSITHYFAEFSNQEPLSLTGRQALAHRKEFVGRHPDTELTPRLERQIQRGDVKLAKTLARRRVRAAESAYDSREWGLARYQAEAAVRALAGHPDRNERLRRKAWKIADRAARRLSEHERRRALALEARATDPRTRAAEIQLATTMLAAPVTIDAIDEPLHDYLDAGGSRDRAEFVLALAQHEMGFERAARRRLARLGAGSPRRERMVRHARAIENDSWQNPYPAFVALQRSGRREELAWRLAGEWVKRPRYPNLPRPIAYLVDAPTIAMTIVMAPVRAITSSWSGGPDFQRAAALAGYRYLSRFPDGDEAQDVLEWLHAYEVRHDRWSRALRLADFIDEFPEDERLELVEKTAESRLASVDKLRRRDNRSSVLRGVAREFPDSEGGHEAGMRARAELEDWSPQRIRVTRGFLLENPDVAGPRGFGLNPRLLNEDPRDGELHPEGIYLRGGRVLEILLMADGGKEDDPPEPRSRRISKQRLTRIASSLEVAVQRNSLIDRDAGFEADASRDLYLERAALGVTEQPDQRATAESSFVYESLRERYGMVRGRDSVLPFDLVFRGSMGGMTLGAFPRWRAPKTTPDAFLYR